MHGLLQEGVAASTRQDGQAKSLGEWLRARVVDVPIVDGNNVFGSRPDGWWNDRAAATARFAQRVAEWCRTHDDDVTLVFDGPLTSATAELAGGNLAIVEAPRRGRGAADDVIARLAAEHLDVHPLEVQPVGLTVVTSDKGLRGRLDPAVTVIGSGRFRELISY
jgi:hypothetical protein